MTGHTAIGVETHPTNTITDADLDQQWTPKFLGRLGDMPGSGNR